LEKIKIDENYVFDGIKRVREKIKKYVNSEQIEYWERWSHFYIR
jgi:hypothetical protein